jgi:hypothetical protein
MWDKITVWWACISKMTPRIMKVIKGTLSVGFGSLVDGGTMYKVLGASLTVLIGNLFLLQPAICCQINFPLTELVGYSCGRLSRHLRCRIWILRSKLFRSVTRVTRLWSNSSKLLCRKINLLMSLRQVGGFLCAYSANVWPLFLC